jgi:Protein of unknown function (DUF1573).
MLKINCNMKKIVLSLGIVLMGAGAVMAQSKKTPPTPPAPVTGTTAAAPATPAAPKPPTTLKAENMSFKAEVHDFGTIPEGPAAEHEFVFTNTGKEPINIESVHASCGCTTPSYSKEPILPGKAGKIKASYNTVGRPNSFTKTITVTSNAGTKVLTITGNVEKAPESSVPENSSMLKTH